MANQTQPKTYTKITKVTLVIYCLIMLVCLIAFLIVSPMTKDYTYLYAFLLCLGPGLIFAFISLIFPMSQLFSAHVGKATIVWVVLGYILKYGLVVGMLIVGIMFEQYFNRWVMLAITLVAPITVIINKIVFANIVSKKPQK